MKHQALTIVNSIGMPTAIVATGVGFSHLHVWLLYENEHQPYGMRVLPRAMFLKSGIVVFD